MCLVVEMSDKTPQTEPSGNVSSLFKHCIVQDNISIYSKELYPQTNAALGEMLNEISITFEQMP